MSRTRKSRTPRVSDETSPPGTFDWPTLVANKDQKIARLEAIYTGSAEKAGARVVKARAVLEDAHMLRLSTGNGAGEACPDRILKHGEPRRGVAMTSCGAGRNSRSSLEDALDKGRSR
jgi:pyruvate/2-oxoglutarate dehydrogenase complex dihydrolipoamide dehydrogenase (E3) component